MFSPTISTARLRVRELTFPRMPNSLRTSLDWSHRPHPSMEKFSVKRYAINAAASAKSSLPRPLNCGNRESSSNFSMKCRTAATVPIGIDLLSFVSIRFVLSLLCLVTYSSKTQDAFILSMDCSKKHYPEY